MHIMHGSFRGFTTEQITYTITFEPGIGKSRRGDGEGWGTQKSHLMKNNRR